MGNTYKLDPNGVCEVNGQDFSGRGNLMVFEGGRGTPLCDGLSKVFGECAFNDSSEVVTPQPSKIAFVPQTSGMIV